MLVENRVQSGRVVCAHRGELPLVHVECLPIAVDPARVGVSNRGECLRDAAHRRLELAVVAGADERAVEQRVRTHDERPLAQMPAQQLDRAAELRVVVGVARGGWPPA